MFINLLGGFIETMVIILIGTQLNNIKYSQIGIKVLTLISLLTSLFIVIIKEEVNAFIYLIGVICFTGSVLSLLASIPLLFSVLSVTYGSLLLMIIEEITLIVLNNFLPVMELWNPYLRLIITIMDSSMLFVIYFILIKYQLYITNINKLHNRGKKNKNGNFYVIILISFSILFFLFALFKKFDIINLNIYIFIIATILITIMYIFRLISKYEEKKIEEKFAALLQSDAERFFNMIRSQRHDFIHHLNAINLMIRQEKFVDVKKYIEDITEEVNIINELLPLHSPAISGLVLHYIQLSRKKYIDFSYDIQDSLKTLTIKDYEANQILGNLLQNAFECVESLPLSKRIVHLQISSNHMNYVFSVKNRLEDLDADINQWFVDGYSTKNKENHSGNGLATIKRIVNHYGGEIFPEMRDGEITFIVFIPRSLES